MLIFSMKPSSLKQITQIVGTGYHVQQSRLLLMLIQCDGFNSALHSGNQYYRSACTAHSDIHSVAAPQ